MNFDVISIYIWDLTQDIKWYTYTYVSIVVCIVRAFNSEYFKKSVNLTIKNVLILLYDNGPAKSRSNWNNEKLSKGNLKLLYIIQYKQV